MRKYLKHILIASSMAIFLIYSSVCAKASTEKEVFKSLGHIETSYITMDTLTDSFDLSVLTDKEIETLVNDCATKTLKDVQDIEIKHSAREVNIVYCVNSDEGDGQVLVNSTLYNFVKLLDGFNFYDFNFEIYLKQTDKNFRVSKTKFASYTFNRETLGNLDFETIDVNTFVSNSDKYWINSIGEQIPSKENQVDDLQLKIINILKSYLKHKISESK